MSTGIPLTEKANRDRNVWIDDIGVDTDPKADFVAALKASVYNSDGKTVSKTQIPVNVLDALEKTLDADEMVAAPKINRNVPRAAAFAQFIENIEKESDNVTLEHLIPLLQAVLNPEAPVYANKKKPAPEAAED